MGFSHLKKDSMKIQEKLDHRFYRYLECFWLNMHLKSRKIHEYMKIHKTYRKFGKIETVDNQKKCKIRKI